MSRLSLTEIGDIRGFALKRFAEIPPHSRIPGMTRDLTTDEVRVACFYEATITVLNRKGAIKPEFLDQKTLEVEIGDFESLPEEGTGGIATSTKPRSKR